jgi:hypothetical protein
MGETPIETSSMAGLTLICAIWPCHCSVEHAGESNKSDGNQCDFDPQICHCAYPLSVSVKTLLGKLAFSSELRPFSYTLVRLRVTSSVDCPGNYWLLFGGGLTCAGPEGGEFLGSDGPIDCGFLPLSQ